MELKGTEASRIDTITATPGSGDAILAKITPESRISEISEVRIGTKETTQTVNRYFGSEVRRSSGEQAWKSKHTTTKQAAKLRGILQLVLSPILTRNYMKKEVTIPHE